MPNEQGKSTLTPVYDEDGDRLYKIDSPLYKGKLPGSTTITGILDKSRPLMYWAANLTVEYFQLEIIEKLVSGELTIQAIKNLKTYNIYKEAKAYNRKISAEARDIGTRVHEVAERIFKFMILSPGEELKMTVDDDLKEPVNALVEWIGDHDVTPLLIEEKVWSKEFGGYAGRVDLVARVDKKTLTIDLKAAKGIYEDGPLQVSSYDFAVNKRIPELKTDGAAILRLDKKKGFPEFKVYSREEVDFYVNEFGLLCSYWHSKKTRQTFLSATRNASRADMREKKKKAKLKPIMRKLPEEDPF